MENKEETSKIEMLFGAIQEAIDSKDEQQLKSYIVQFNSNIRNLMRKTSIDKIDYIIIQFLNGIMATFPTVRVNACENLNEFLNKCLDEVKFEKQALLELKGYLKNCVRDRDYTNLDSVFAILVVILGMHNERNEKLSVEGNIWKCGISGIKYIPVSTNEGTRTDTLKDAVNTGLEKLGRRRIRIRK